MLPFARKAKRAARLNARAPWWRSAVGWNGEHARDQLDQREQRHHPEAHQRRRVESLGERQLVPLRRDREVDEDEAQPDVADLPVKLQQRVLAERCRERLEPAQGSPEGGAAVVDDWSGGAPDDVVQRT